MIDSGRTPRRIPARPSVSPGRPICDFYNADAGAGSILYAIPAQNVLRIVGFMDAVAMQDNRLGRASQRAEDHCRDRNTARDETPTPNELLFEIGLALGGFLSIALLAELAVMAMQAG
ncbi:MAG TPA: hypothetical protein VKA03_01540 [Methylovirgula sp.]|nr:hypothetical protein [Methylovirgula sp.]